MLSGPSAAQHNVTGSNTPTGHQLAGQTGRQTVCQQAAARCSAAGPAIRPPGPAAA